MKRARREAESFLNLLAEYRLSPGVIAVHFERGSSLEALGKTSEALSSYKAVAELKATSAAEAVLQAMAKKRAETLGGGIGSGSGNAPAGPAANCAKGQTCL